MFREHMAGHFEQLLQQQRQIFGRQERQRREGQQWTGRGGRRCGRAESAPGQSEERAQRGQVFGQRGGVCGGVGAGRGICI